MAMAIPVALPVDLPVAEDSVISLADVALVEGPDGVIGHGALGEVRRATWCGTSIALKDLFMLRDDAAAIAAFARSRAGAASASSRLRCLYADCSARPCLTNIRRRASSSLRFCRSAAAASSSCPRSSSSGAFMESPCKTST